MGSNHMVGENTASIEEAAKDTEGDADNRQRSTIGFPYNNLDDAIEVAQAIHTNVGAGECDDSQLSAWLKMSSKSSGYRVQVSAARMFGLIEGGASGYRLAALGRQIVDPQQEREARVRAFLNVPLYRAVFEKYKGHVIPPAAALERDIVGLGVAEKQKSRARAVMERSADQAGFFAQGRDRLVQPGIVHRDGLPPPPPPKPEEDGNGVDKKRNRSGGGNGGDDEGLHPFIVGLLKTLPPPGDDPTQKVKWAAKDRAKWLQTAANIFDLIYEGDGGIEVRPAAATRSPRPDE